MKIIKKSKIMYDFENDIFSAVPVKRSYDSSIQIENLIFDLNKNGKINGIEILSASKLFNIDKFLLKNLISGDIKIVASNDFIYVKINFKSSIRNKEKISIINIERLKPKFVEQGELNLAVAWLFIKKRLDYL